MVTLPTLLLVVSTCYTYPMDNAYAAPGSSS